jgi:hypothetical protein
MQRRFATPQPDGYRSPLRSLLLEYALLDRLRMFDRLREHS